MNSDRLTFTSRICQCLFRKFGLWNVLVETTETGGTIISTMGKPARGGPFNNTYSTCFVEEDIHQRFSKGTWPWKKVQVSLGMIHVLCSENWAYFFGKQTGKRVDELWGIVSWLGAQTWQLSKFHVGFGDMSLFLAPTFGMSDIWWLRSKFFETRVSVWHTL